VSLKSAKNDGNLRADRNAFCIVSRTVNFRMRNVSGESFRENSKHFLRSINNFFENSAFYEMK